jgi:hypothetical protein
MKRRYGQYIKITQASDQIFIIPFKKVCVLTLPDTGVIITSLLLCILQFNTDSLILIRKNTIFTYEFYSVLMYKPI